ncbi:BQ5605_C005g03267 [Microbotryum silenes-dioicae]|uniref:BQ5605_C005g03267 protein n=1 Tax=Microbotryum silenes-dioicae TaxID=796604 RepID=A0A2X0PCE4_9BASI|nr:BQ5605_C005g03267 [Microbotryum silenes-dioicae]
MDDGGAYYTSASTSLPPTAPPTMAASRPRRQRHKTSKALAGSDDEFEYTPRSSAPKIKLKMNQEGAGSASGSGTATTKETRPGAVNHDATGIGWDRELDSDPEVPLAVEEQFLLRLPKDLAPQLREMVEARTVNPKDVWFKFKDSRRAVFHLKGKSYSSKLFDLPTLLESQRLTGSGGGTVKIADVCQMLLVDEDEIQDEADVTKEAFNIEDFSYPHGITPPLKHVRKRRFRKRINKRTIEIVESAVEKLLEKDQAAEQVQYELLDHDVVSEDEYDNVNDDDRGGVGSSIGAPTPRREGSASSIAGDDDEGMDDGDRDDDDADEAGAGSGYDSDLANEINKGMEAIDRSSSEDDDSDSDDAGGLFGGGSSDDDDDEEQAIDPEVIEQKKRIKLLLEEIKDLESKITDSENKLSTAANPIFKKRFEDTIKKLTADRDGKRAAHSKAVAEMEKRRSDEEAAAVAATDVAANPEPLPTNPTLAEATSGEAIPLAEAATSGVVGEGEEPTATLAGGEDRMEIG